MLPATTVLFGMTHEYMKQPLVAEVRITWFTLTDDNHFAYAKTDVLGLQTMEFTANDGTLHSDVDTGEELRILRNQVHLDRKQPHTSKE